MDFDGFGLSVDCGGQKNLRQLGPMIPAAWSAFSEEETKDSGKLRAMPNLKQVQGYILLDTGAGHVGIDENVARELSLSPTGKEQEIYGVAGRTKTKSYLARLIIGVTPLKNNQGVADNFYMGIPLEAWALPDIQQSHLDWEYTDPKGQPIKVIGVLGRIFLQFVKMNYNGLTGKLDMFIDKSSMYPKRD